MNLIRFPYFNLDFKLNKVAVNLFGIDIYWYAILIAVSFVIFIFAAKKRSEKYNIRYEDVLDLSIILIPASLICARIYYVMFNWEYYNGSLFRVFDLRSGGLAIYGGVLGGVLTIYMYCKNKKIEILDFTDLIVPFLALGQSIR